MAATNDNDLEIVLVKHVLTIAYKPKGQVLYSLACKAATRPNSLRRPIPRLHFLPAITLFIAYAYSEKDLDLPVHIDNTEIKNIQKDVPGKVDRVLIVDDSDGIRDTLSVTLEREGYAVTTAGNGEEAQDLIEANRFDVILLDVNLPGRLSGLDILNTIRKQHSLLDLPVVMISGSSESSTVISALQAGANDYLVKPLDILSVRARIKTQLTLKHLKELNDRFLRTASHDLKKPVMLILDVARQIQEHCPPGTAMTEDNQSALSLLIESGEYMQQIISEFLDLGSMHSGQYPVSKITTDLGAIVRQAVARNSGYAKSKDMNLELKFLSDLPLIIVDETRIMQVLDNFIGNAIKFCPAKSRIVVTTKKSGAWLVCEVSDNGPGIADEDMDKLFVEYAKIQNRPTGKEKSSGLGLAICKELILLHDGEVGADNNPGGGARFWFRLPTMAKA